MENNVDKKIINLYENSDFFKIYGLDFWITSIFIVVSLLLITFIYITNHLNKIKQNWHKERCNPLYLPFAGHINPQENMTKLEYTFENFNYCNKKFISSANEYLPNLKDGFVIDTILFKEEFIKSEIIEPFDDGIYDYQGGTERNEVRSRGVYEVVLSRQGSWLFFKLFLGSFLSLILSWFVFLIPMSEFDAKSNLSVGAIFGAVGNKYFVDSAISSQVLTTADLINNLIIAVVIFNVLIMIYQKNNKLKSKFLKHENSALKFSIGTFIICLACLLIFIA